MAVYFGNLVAVVGEKYRRTAPPMSDDAARKETTPFSFFDIESLPVCCLLVS